MYAGLRLAKNADAAAGHVIEGLWKVFYLESDVMEPRAALLEEVRDGALAQWMDDLDHHVADLQERGLHAVKFRLLDLDHFEPEQVDVEVVRGVEVIDNE